jgi:Transposase DDE domain
MSKRARERSLKPRKRAESLLELPLWPETVRGGKLVKLLERYVNGLVDEHPHGNRALFLDDVFIAHLLAFFNPTLRSLRTLEDFSQTQQAQKHLSIPRICRSTLSDFHRLTEPERLRPIIDALRAELLRKTARRALPSDLLGVLQQIIAVDGTFLPAAAGVAWAICERNQRDDRAYRARLDMHVDVHTWLPDLIVVPEAGESEADSAARTITPGALHVYDRAYGSFALIAAHFQKRGDQLSPRADFVLRLKQPGPNSPIFHATEERTLSAEAKAAGVISDRLGTLPRLLAQQGLDLTLREVVLLLPDGTQVRLITNRLDLPAEIIALIYKWRWQIELFFRWLKCCANFNHLISHCREGVLLNFYVVIIGTMLMYLHTGYRPSKYAFVLLGLAAQGASLDELLPILRERERQCERDRQSSARRRAKKKAASQ